jgi:Ca-activated chloride channel family protein
MQRLLGLIGLVIWMGACSSRPKAEPTRETGAARTTSTDETFAELRTIKGAVRVREGSAPARAPYRRERLVDGEVIELPQGALAWMRRDGGATWLIAGPAELTARAESVELRSGRAFIDSELGAPVQIQTARGLVELSEARASIELANDGTVSAYVLRGAARVAGELRAVAGEQLTLKPGSPATRSPVVSWEDWTGGLATADPVAEPAPFGIGTVGARAP